MSEPGSPASPAVGPKSPGSTMKKTKTPGASNDMATHGVFSYSGSTNVGTEYQSKHGARPRFSIWLFGPRNSTPGRPDLTLHPPSLHSRPRAIQRPADDPG